MRKSVDTNRNPARAEHGGKKGKQIRYGGDPLNGTAEEIFSEIYNTYSDAIYRFCYPKLGNRHDTEDVTQETFFRLVKNEQVLYSEDGDYIKKWLYKVAENLINSHYSHWYQKNREKSFDNDMVMEQYQRDHASETDCREVMDLMDAVGRLPQKEYTAIYLYYYEGYSAKEIAEIQGTSESAIFTALNRGRKKLEKILKKG